MGQLFLEFLNFYFLFLGTSFISFHLLEVLYLISGESKKEKDNSNKSSKDRKGKKRTHLLFHY